MPEGVDIATLGLRVDAREFVGAKKAVDEFAAAGAKAERQATQMGQNSSAAYRSAAIAARQSAQQQAQALEREFRDAQAAIKLELSRGLISPREAERAGNEAALAFNRGLAQAIDTASGAGGLNRNTAAGSQAFGELTDKFKDVEKAGRNAGLGLGRLNNSMVTLAGQALGTNSATNRLIDTVGTFAIGTAYMIPVLAGLAAIGVAWQEITKESRKAKQEQDEALASLEKLREAQRDRDRGTAGGTQRDVEAALERRAELTERIARLQREADVGEFLFGALGQNTAQGLAAQEKLVNLREELAEVNERVAAGERAIAEAREDAANDRFANIEGLIVGADAQERITAATIEGAEALAQVQRDLAREADLRQTLSNVAEEDRDFAVEMVNRKHDLIQLLADELRLRREAEAAAKRFADQLERANDVDRERYERELARQRSRPTRVPGEDGAVADFQSLGFDLGELKIPETIQRITEDVIVLNDETGKLEISTRDLKAALGDIGGLFGEVGRSIGGLISGAISGNPLAILGAGIGGIGSFLSSSTFDFGDQSSERFRELFLEAQRLRDAFRELGDELSDDLDIRRLRALGDDPAARELELQRQADKELQDFLDEFNKSGTLAAALPRGQRPDADFFENASIDELKAFLDSLGEAAFGAKGDLAAFIRTLIDLKEVQGLEAAQREAAKAARELAEAEEEAARARALARQTILDELNVTAREAALAGNDRAALQARLEAQAEAEKAALLDRLEAGEIEVDLYNRLVAVIDGEVLKSLADFDAQLEETAARLEEVRAAEAFRAQQDLQNLELRRLVALGMEDEAFLLRQQLELEQALFEERSQAYIELLQLVHAEERAARERAKQAQAAREQAKALEESTKTIDGMARALNGPAGLVLALRRYQTVLGAGAPNALGIRAPTFGGGAQASVNVAPGAIVIEGSNLSPEEIADAVISRITREYRAGGGNRVTNVLG